MAIYFFLIAGVIIVGVPLCSRKCGKAGRIIYCLAAAVVFIFISAMRFQVGHDYTQYAVKYFDMQMMFPEDIMAERMEKGFLMPLYALNSGYDDYTTVFIYTSIVIYSAVFYLIYKRSSSPWISTAVYLCLGLYFNSLCFLRQVMAAMLIVYGMKFIYKKMPLQFMVIAFAASAFHWSALLMIPLFFLLSIKPGYIYLGVVTVLSLVAYVFSRPIMSWAVGKLFMYKGYDPMAAGEAANGISPRYTIMFFIIFAVCFAFRKRLIEKNHANAVYINCLMYTVVFELMGTHHAVLSRFAILTNITAIFIVPDLVTVIREYVQEKFRSRSANFIKTIHMCALGCLSIYFVASYTILMMVNYNGAVPYVSQINRPYDLFSAPEDQDVIVEEDEPGNDEFGEENDPEIVESVKNEEAGEELDWLEENVDDLSEEELVWIDAYREFLQEYNDSDYDEYFDQFYEDYLERNSITFD